MRIMISPMVSALECEASSLRSIHSSDELIGGELCEPTMCTDLVAIVNWGGMSYS